MEDFKGKVAVVTGGASGLGKASASLFARRGASVAILDIDARAGEAAVKEIEGKGGKAAFMRCDVTDEAQVERAMRGAVEAFGSLDILHANAGIIDKPKFIGEISFSDWRRIIDINLNGMFLAAKYGIGHMLSAGSGVVVFTGSNWAYVCDPGFSSYAASKGAVVAFARALALDHAKDNIRINVVCPGNMMTPLLERQLSEEPDPAAALKKMGRISRPEEIANLVAFLAGDDASAMKGSAVIIDQGETLGYGKGLGPSNPGA
jgi:NAD(P)-dependent dehydrogenase (short-subunit alcohol dehydrogenase family)